MVASTPQTIWRQPPLAPTRGETAVDGPHGWGGLVFLLTRPLQQQGSGCTGQGSASQTSR